MVNLEYLIVYNQQNKNLKSGMFEYFSVMAITLLDLCGFSKIESNIIYDRLSEELEKFELLSASYHMYLDVLGDIIVFIIGEMLKAEYDETQQNVIESIINRIGEVALGKNSKCQLDSDIIRRISEWNIKAGFNFQSKDVKRTVRFIGEELLEGFSLQKSDIKCIIEQINSKLITKNISLEDHQKYLGIMYISTISEMMCYLLELGSQNPTEDIHYILNIIMDANDTKLNGDIKLELDKLQKSQDFIPPDERIFTYLKQKGYKNENE